MKDIKIPSIGLWAIAACLLIIHLTLNVKADRYSHLAMSILFWLAAFSVVEDQRDQLKSGSDLGSVCLGAILIVGILLKSATFPQGDFLSISPLLSGLGLALLASGWRSLGQYWQSLFTLFFLGIPRVLLFLLPDISPLTAKFSALLLWYIGIPISLEGNYIFIPNGGVEVVPSCSGLNLITYMLALIVVFLVLFPTLRIHKVIAPIVAVLLGFIVNAIRVALLAILSTNTTQQAFKYWHDEGGALIFVLVAIVLLGIYCGFLIHHTFSRHQAWKD